MSDPTQDKPDELAGTEQPFVHHLMELRDRMIKAVIAIGVAAALLAFFPGPGALYGNSKPMRGSRNTATRNKPKPVANTVGRCTSARCSMRA